MPDYSYYLPAGDYPAAAEIRADDIARGSGHDARRPGREADVAGTGGLTAAELERRAANIRAHGDTSRRGVAEAIGEARRQFGFADHGAARYWLDQAECSSNLITAREMNDRIDARSAPVRPLQWGMDAAPDREAEAG